MSTRRERTKQSNVQQNRQLKEIEAARIRDIKERNLNLWKSRFLMDLTKLVFAGVLIGGIFQPVPHPVLLYLCGIVLFTTFLLVGYRYYKSAIK